LKSEEQLKRRLVELRTTLNLKRDARMKVPSDGLARAKMAALNLEIQRLEGNIGAIEWALRDGGV
jgi:hypothetical protein